MGRWFKHWLFEAYRIDVRALALIRWFYMGFTLVFLGQTLDGIASLPASVYHPAPGLATWLPVPFPFALMVILSLVLLISGVAIWVGFRTPLASRAFSLALVLLFAVNQSLGKIDHVLLLAVFPMLMSWSGWGNAWSVDARNSKGAMESEAWPLALLAVTIGFLWFSAGVFKWQGGWLDSENCASCWHLVQNAIGNEREAWLSFEGGLPENLEWVDWMTVVFELLFLPAVLAVRAFRTWIWLALGFHLTVQLTMGIDFTAFGLVYLPFVAWEVFSWKGDPQRGPSIWLGVALIILLGVGLAVTESLFNWVFGPEEYLRGVLALGTLFLGAGILLFMSLLKRRGT